MAYLDEIGIDLGKTPVRPEPVLPEETALRNVMRRELEEKKRNRRKSYG